MDYINTIFRTMQIKNLLLLGREDILKDCKTDEERMRYREMWSAEDNAEKIASAIRSIRRGFF